jgi:hypothetical protein
MWCRPATHFIYLTSYQLTFFFSLSENQPKKEYFSINEIKKNATAQLHAVPWDAFSDCFVQLLVRFKKSVAVNGGDFGAVGK